MTKVSTRWIVVVCLGLFACVPQGRTVTSGASSRPHDAPSVPTEADYRRAFAECERTAQSGGGNVCMNAGATLTLSPTLTRLVEECRHRNAGNNGDGACFELARRYRDGIDVPIDHVRSYEYAAAVCDQPTPRANWGACHLFGIEPRL